MFLMWDVVTTVRKLEQNLKDFFYQLLVNEIHIILPHCQFDVNH